MTSEMAYAQVVVADRRRDLADPRAQAVRRAAAELAAERRAALAAGTGRRLAGTGRRPASPRRPEMQPAPGR